MDDLLAGKKLLKCVVHNADKEVTFEALFVGTLVEEAETGNKQVALIVGLVPPQGMYRQICEKYGVENLEWEVMQEASPL